MIRLYSVQVVTRIFGICCGARRESMWWKDEGGPLPLVSRRPPGNFFGAEVSIRPDSPVAKSPAQHISEILRPGEQRSITHRLASLRMGQLGLESLHQLANDPFRDPGARRGKDEAEQNEMG